MEPLMEPVPDHLVTPRLILRNACAADAAALNAAVVESLEALRVQMPWAQVAPSLAQSEAECRRLQAKFLLREDLTWLMFERQADGRDGVCVGGTGLHRIDWAVRRFEIGYWCRTSHVGRGLVSEAVAAVARMTFDALAARRIEIRMDDRNERSWRVAERAGFTLEGVLRCQSLTPTGAPRDMRVYATVAPDAASVVDRAAG